MFLTFHVCLLATPPQVFTAIHFQGPESMQLPQLPDPLGVGGSFLSSRPYPPPSLSSHCKARNCWGDGQPVFLHPTPTPAAPTCFLHQRQARSLCGGAVWWVTALAQAMAKHKQNSTLPSRPLRWQKIVGSVQGHSIPPQWSPSTFSFTGAKSAFPRRAEAGAGGS